MWTGRQVRPPASQHGFPDAVATKWDAMTSRQTASARRSRRGRASARRDQNEIVEAALAHVVGSKVERAYRRGDMFEKRRPLMQQWATFCTTAPVQEPSNLAPMRRMG
jgi:hypothetical protein